MNNTFFVRSPVHALATSTGKPCKRTAFILPEELDCLPVTDWYHHERLVHIAIGTLRRVFGDLPIGALSPQHIYKFVDKRSQKKTNAAGRTVGGRTIAHREVEVLSHAYTKAVEWGYVARHPFKGEVRLQGEKPRTRYVEDWEIVECLALESKQKKGSVHAIHAYMRLKLMTGLARGDLLRLTAGSLKEDGIHVQRHKTA